MQESCKKKQPLTSKQVFYRVVILFAAALILMLVVAPPLMAGMLEIDERTVSIGGMPTNLKNLKVAFASDFHYTPASSGNALRAVNKLNAFNADLIILGGDYSNSPEGAIAFFADMPQLNARIGIFAVLGDTDRDDEHFQELLSVMRSKGITPLCNSVSRVKIGGSYLYIAGVDDHYHSYDDVAGVAAQLSERDAVIVCAHTPEVLTQMEHSRGADGNTHWYDLALFGHTHGGQMIIGSHTLFPELLEDIEPRCVSGWLDANRASVLVSNGVGTEYYPGRLFAKPQVHLMTLKVR